MVIAVRAEEGPSGLEVVKTADDAEGEARLAHERDMLERCAHPGVVEVVRHEGGTLVLRHLGTALSGLGRLPLDQAAGVATAVADVVESIHRLGVAHNRISPDHVVVDERGRPRLAGFAEATDATDATSADDVAALGQLLEALIDDAAGVPWQPPGPRMARGRRAKQAERELRAVAASARHDDPSRRPTARQFAKAVHAALPTMTLPAPSHDSAPAAAESTPRTFSSIPDDVDPTASLEWSDDDLSFLALEDDDDVAFEGGPDPDDDAADAPLDHEDDDQASTFSALAPAAPRRGPRWRTSWAPVPLAVTVAVLVVGVVVGASVARSARPFGATPLTGLTAPTSTTPPPSTTVSDSTCETTVPVGPDADGNGCPDPVRLDDRLVTVGTHRIELGVDGDLVVLGDWDCDGVDTPALLRPGTGEVFVFSSWSLDRAHTVERIAVVPDARQIEPSSAPCPAPVVVDGNGRRHRVHVS